jgi:hypothetical protein
MSATRRLLAMHASRAWLRRSRMKQSKLDQTKTSFRWRTCSSAQISCDANYDHNRFPVVMTSLVLAHGSCTKDSRVIVGALQGSIHSSLLVVVASSKTSTCYRIIPHNARAGHTADMLAQSRDGVAWQSILRRCRSLQPTTRALLPDRCRAWHKRNFHFYLSIRRLLC